MQDEDIRKIWQMSGQIAALIEGQVEVKRSLDRMRTDFMNALGEHVHEEEVKFQAMNDAIQNFSRWRAAIIGAVGLMAAMAGALGEWVIKNVWNGPQ